MNLTSSKYGCRFNRSMQRCPSATAGVPIAQCLAGPGVEPQRNPRRTLYFLEFTRTWLVLLAQLDRSSAF